MNRIDRALGIVLLLRSGATISAGELARRFAVSPRTIYRDVEALAAVGVPVYAEQGRHGGFRLVEGYFLPPVTFSEGEALALLVGVALLARLRATPFAGELELAERKLLAAMPEGLRTSVERVRPLIGIEPLPPDLLHPELHDPQLAAPMPTEGRALNIFLRALLDGATVALRYHSPYRQASSAELLAPQGLIWDRERWYLVALRAGDDRPRLYRADRVLTIEALATPAAPPDPQALASLLGRSWLRAALERWSGEAPVSIRMRAEQAERLRRDWYYGQARFSDQPDGSLLVTFGEVDRANTLALLRWLGPGAELLRPRAWRAAARAELRVMLAAHETPADEPATPRPPEIIPPPPGWRPGPADWRRRPGYRPIVPGDLVPPV